jgi:hypothetical protein
MANIIVITVYNNLDADNQLRLSEEVVEIADCCKASSDTGSDKRHDGSMYARSQVNGALAASGPPKHSGAGMVDASRVDQILAARQLHRQLHQSERNDEVGTALTLTNVQKDGFAPETAEVSGLRGSYQIQTSYVGHRVSQSK